MKTWSINEEGQAELLNTSGMHMEYIIETPDGFELYEDSEMATKRHLIGTYPTLKEAVEQHGKLT